MNFLASSECLAFLFTAKAVGEPKVVVPPPADFCGSWASPQFTAVLPACLAATIPEMYQEPMGIMAVCAVSNMVR